ncbi:hypothetical protein WCE41_08835 [Luteimonas sp. MJ246]|uniref:hypothetical protein n=1 Tax=Luteimonas sp. MJ174 TaxID=3129237 RepID=UPI0031BAF2CA
MPMPSMLRSLLVATAVAGLLAACRPAPTDVQVAAGSDLSRPALAVEVLAGHMRTGDFAAFARDAVPPALHAQLGLAWRTGHTRWPLDELPFAEHLPTVLGTLAAPDAERTLAADFERQIAGSERELRAAAATMGMFGVQYVEHQGDFSEDERDHYAQLVTAVAQWAATAPLADRSLARAAIPRLVAAARAAGPTTADGMAEAGMEASLQRLGAFSVTATDVLAGYGLDLDAALDSARASLQVQQGDRATVRLRYSLAGSPVDTVISVERIDGRWYLSDYLAHAREAVRSAGLPATPPASLPDSPPAPQPGPGAPAGPVAAP